MATIFERLAAKAYMPAARTWLIYALLLLLALSLLMVASASIPFAAGRHMADLKFFWSQLGYMIIAVAAGALVYQFPLNRYYHHGLMILVFAITLIMLIATVLFAPSINGSKRWLNIAGFSFQPAELAKVFLVFVVAEFMQRRATDLRYRNILHTGSRVAIFWYVPIFGLLYLQPDYGSIIVIGATMVVMLVVGGAPIRQLVWLSGVLLIIGAVGLWQAEYRQSRLLSFADPFDDVLGTDYQLARSLAAFGHGQTFGVGYSNSIQKLSHLPEAHTDFLLAITGEELGFVGVFMVLLLEGIIIAALLRISYNALVAHQLKLSYTVFGFAVIIFGQVFINAGMNMGMLPTKGLTMPFFSYGGSSMLFSVIMVAIALKADSQRLIIIQNNQNREY